MREIFDSRIACLEMQLFRVVVPLYALQLQEIVSVMFLHYICSATASVNHMHANCVVVQVVLYQISSCEAFSGFFNIFRTPGRRSLGMVLL